MQQRLLPPRIIATIAASTPRKRGGAVTMSSSGSRARGAASLLAVLTLILAGCASTPPAATSAPASAPASTAAPASIAATPEGCAGFPTSDIELVIPYGPGGGFDTWARLVAPVLQEKLPTDVNVVPLNREGAGGLVGVTEVLGAQPDGHTIVITEPGVLAT